jgi:hypothetical protein
MVNPRMICKADVECKIIQTSLGNIYFKQIHPYFVTIYPLINVWQTHLPNTIHTLAPHAKHVKHIILHIPYHVYNLKWSKCFTTCFLSAAESGGGKSIFSSYGYLPLFTLMSYDYVLSGYGNDYLPWLYTQPLQPKGGFF